jgi:hypothetical protein
MLGLNNSGLKIPIRSAFKVPILISERAKAELQ